MSETLWDVENLLRLGWTSSAASRPRKSASKCDFQEWPRKIHEFVQNICKFSLNCQEAALNWKVSTALAQARQVQGLGQVPDKVYCFGRGGPGILFGFDWPGAKEIVFCCRSNLFDKKHC